MIAEIGTLGDLGPWTTVKVENRNSWKGPHQPALVLAPCPDLLFRDLVLYRINKRDDTIVKQFCIFGITAIMNNDIIYVFVVKLISICNNIVHLLTPM